MGKRLSYILLPGKTPRDAVLFGCWADQHPLVLAFLKKNWIKGRAAEVNILRMQLQRMNFLFGIQKSISKKKSIVSTDPVHHTFGFHIPLNNFLMTAEQRSEVEDTQSAHSQLAVCYNLQPVVLWINPAKIQTHILHQCIISVCIWHSH